MAGLTMDLNVIDADMGESAFLADFLPEHAKPDVFRLWECLPMFFAMNCEFPTGASRVMDLLASGRLR